MPISRETRPGVLPRAQQVLASAAIALADDAPVVIISAQQPVNRDDELTLWWAAIEQLARPDQVVAVCVAPPARALSLPPGHSIVDLTQPAVLSGERA